METLSIRTDYIELIKALKIMNLVASGGEAKYVVDEGMVVVDGEVETRKRRKLYPGSTITFQGNIVQVVSQNQA